MKLALVIALALAAASPVPMSVRHAISRQVPERFRYVPTQVPVGYRYARWRGSGSGLEIDFARMGRPRAVAFVVGAAGPAGTCTAGGTHTYRFGSTRVSSEWDRYDEQFWRCVRSGTVSIEATLRLGGGVTPAERRAVAAMVASATHSK